MITGCNSAYRLRYWNLSSRAFNSSERCCCNSAYRLRYWNAKDTTAPFFKTKFRCNSAYRLRYWNLAWLLSMMWPACSCNSAYRLRYWNLVTIASPIWICPTVATVLTACGIETITEIVSIVIIYNKLQQCLPLAVLKLSWIALDKQHQSCCNSAYRLRYWNRIISQDWWNTIVVATVLTACGIETSSSSWFLGRAASCNSAYRLRYWNRGRISRHRLLHL